MQMEAGIIIGVAGVFLLIAVCWLFYCIVSDIAKEEAKKAIKLHENRRH